MELSKRCLSNHVSTPVTLDDFLAADDQPTRQPTPPGSISGQPPIYRSSPHSLISETGGEFGTLGVVLNVEGQVYRTRGVMKQIGFGLSVIITQIIAAYFVSGFFVLIPHLTQDLNNRSIIWAAKVYPTLLACCMIPFGRLADIYGGFSCYVRGILCFCSFTLGAALSRSFGVLLAARACQGVAAAVFLPAGIKLMLESYPRGRRRNVFLSIYAATVPLGFFLGNVVAGATVRSSTWTWYFWGGFILTCVALVGVFAFRPSDSQSCQRDLPMDWLECCVLVTGLIFTVFSLTNTAQYEGHWRSPGILVTFLGGVIFLGFAAYLEVRVVEAPLIPRACFEASMLPQVLVVLFFTYGGFGIYLLYAVLSFQDSWGVPPIIAACYFSPMVFGGLIASVSTSILLDCVSGTLLMVFAGVASILAPILFLVRPDGGSYWAYIFPSMICATLGVHITFVVTTVMISRLSEIAGQGFVGALINSWYAISMAISLGFASMVASEHSWQPASPNYKPVFWLDLAFVAFSVIITLIFVRIGKADGS